MGAAHTAPGPSAQAWAHLLVEGDPTLIRQCPGCTIIFYDSTKAHRRRWCSMALVATAPKCGATEHPPAESTNRRT